MQRGYCMVTGIAFDFTDEHQVQTGRHRNPYSPSLDRIDPRSGYTDENSQIVITQYNLMKGELTDAEILQLCRMIAARNPV